MKKVLSIGLVSGIVGMSAVSIAQVQNNIQSPRPQPQYFTLRAGGVLAIDSRLRDVSNSFIGLGADYTLSSQWFKNGETFLSVDWLTNTSHSHSRFNFFPFAINERFFLNGAKNETTNVGNNAQTYFFIGVGGTYFDNIQQFTWGGRAGIGFQFAGNWIAEGVLTATVPTREPNKVAGDTAGIYIGYKFGG